MVLDDRNDMHDDFNIQGKIRKLEEEIAHHQESHAVANKLLMVERNKISSMEATIKFEVAGKYNAYKDLKVASTLICQVEKMINDTNRLYVTIDKRIKNLKMEEKFVVSMKKFRKIISDLKRKHTDYRIEKKKIDKVFEIK